jgi:hypothetical protein
MSPEQYAAHKHAELMGQSIEEVSHHGTRSRTHQSRPGQPH